MRRHLVGAVRASSAAMVAAVLIAAVAIAAAACAHLDNEGEWIDAHLNAAGRLYATVADLDEDPTREASLRLFDAEGLSVVGAASQTEWRRRPRGDFHVLALVPGTYRAEITTEDGRTWSHEVEILPLRNTTIVIR